MLLKDKLFGLITIVQKYFLIPFCLAVFIILVLTSAFGLRVSPFGSLFVLYTGLVFGVIAFLLWFKKLDEGNKTRKLIVECCSPLFLMSLLILTVSNLNFLTSLKPSLISALNLAMTSTSIFSVLIIFYTNREKVNEEQDVKFRSRIKKYLVFPKWVNKKSLFYSLVFIILINCILVLSNNLSLLPLQNDEFLTQNAVEYIASGHLKPQDLLNGADSLSSNRFYSRAIPYSLFSTIIVELSGGNIMNIAALRYSSVIFGILFLLVILFYIKNLRKTYIILPLLRNSP